jgi:hypothetical protein
MNACLLTYDIPENATYTDRYGRERPFPSPAPQLRPYAIHLELSAWVLREGNIPHALIGRILASGGRAHVVKFAPEEGAKVVEMAVASVRKSVRDGLARAEASIKSAERAADRDQANPDLEAQEARKRFARRTGATMRRLSRLLKDLRSAAGKFGIDPDHVQLNQAGNHVTSFNEAIRVRAERLLSLAAELRAQTGNPDDAMAAARKAWATRQARRAQAVA